MLQCYVSTNLLNILLLFINQHSFCEACIRNWLFKRKNECPVCKKKIPLKSFERDTWSIIDYDSNTVEYIVDYNKEFYELFINLFLNENK